VPARASLVANEMIASTITSSVIIALSFAAAASAHASCTKRSHTLRHSAATILLNQALR
jgi:site-specific recombinase XerD